MSRAAATVVFEPGGRHGAGRRPLRRVPADRRRRGRRRPGRPGARAGGGGAGLRRRVRGDAAPQRPDGPRPTAGSTSGRAAARPPRSSPRPSWPRPAGRPTSAGCATWATCSPRPPSPPTSTPSWSAAALRLAESLSWRQLALLAGVGRRDRVPLPMAPLEDEPRAWTAWGAREDVAELQRAGLLDPPAAAAPARRRRSPGCGRPTCGSPAAACSCTGCSCWTCCTTTPSPRRWPTWGSPAPEPEAPKKSRPLGLLGSRRV